MKKNKIINRIEMLESAVCCIKNTNPNLEEKRFRTIQRTVSKLKNEIEEKDKLIETMRHNLFILKGIV